MDIDAAIAYLNAVACLSAFFASIWILQIPMKDASAFARFAVAMFAGSHVLIAFSIPGRVPLFEMLGNAGTAFLVICVARYLLAGRILILPGGIFGRIERRRSGTNSGTNSGREGESRGAARGIAL